MREIPEDRQIYISGRVWHEVMHKVNLTPFIYTLHDQLNLTSFGKGLARFYFSFIIVKPDDQINTPYARFNKSKKFADIAISIPYNLYDNASEKETIQLMEDAYLKGIDQLNELSIQDFDATSLKNVVAAIFAQDNWHELAEQEV
ncbi:MAG: hypothetical protein MI974_12700 [Chitinophagales bacterium]|nr:hypothetical protein [Chitinophagales bacterium]